MGRPHRAAEGGYVYHVLNRANARLTIFEDAADFEAFEKVLLQAVERTKTRLLAYCVMPNHWHLAAWPLPRQPHWVEHVNEPLTEAELTAVRRSVQRGNPFGDATWCDRAIRRLQLESTLRPRGRPKKDNIGS